MSKFLLIVFLLLLGSCVSSTKYQKLQNAVDSLKTENQLLLEKNEELLNGEERLYNLIKLYSTEEDYVKAEESLQALKDNHPESPLFISNKKFFDEISKEAQHEKAMIEKKIKDSIMLANIENIGDWEIGNFVNDFDEPTGEHYVYQSFYGVFSNTATAGRQLLVRIRFYSYNNTKKVSSLIDDFYFDEYINGVEDERIYDAYKIKIVNKAQRKVYTKEPYANFIRDESGKVFSIMDILLNEGIYEFDITFENSTRYRFTVNTQYLNNALIKAGLKELE